MKNKNKFKKIDVHKFVPRVSAKDTPPGTLQYLGRPRTEPCQIELIEYDESEAKRYHIDEPEQLSKFLATEKIKWIKVTGVHDLGIIARIGEIFQINQLDLEDITNTTQRPRMEERDNYIFQIFNALLINPEDKDVTIEQVSLILGKNYLLSFHETESQLFDGLLKRILVSKGRV